MSLCCVRSTGVAAISETFNPGRAFLLNEIRIHLSAAGGAGNLTATVNAVKGSVYDSNILNKDMTTVLDHLLQPTNPMPYEKGDTIDVAWANAGGKTWGLEIWYTPR